MILKYRPKDEEFVYYQPGIMKMARMVTPKDGRFRIGFANMEASKKVTRAIWFDEVFYIIKGGLKFTCLSPPSFKKEVVEVTAGDAFFMSKGTQMTFETSDSPCRFLYVAVPASSKGMEYIVKEEVKPDQSHLMPT